MDSLTQAVLGAAVYGAGMGKFQGRKALAIGAALGTLPDLDVLIPYDNPISSMTYHRGFSHSLFILTGLALVATWVVFKKNPHRAYTAKRLFVSLMLALTTHPIIDAMTMYGTQLLYPLTPPPTSWATVFIIDPLYTLPLIIACMYALHKGLTDRAIKGLTLAVAVGFLYFGVGFFGKHHHERRVHEHLSSQGVAITRMISGPTPFNTILWRVLAQDEQGNVYESYSGYFDRQTPEYVRKPMNAHLKEPIWQSAPLLQRLDWFTDGWLSYEIIDDTLVVTDLRMGYAGRQSFGVFVVAQKTDGTWHAITPKRHDDGQPRTEKGALAKLWERLRGHGQLV